MTTQPEPYSLQASCELSQDYFLTSGLIIGTSDQVIPFVNPYTKQTEAVVFSAGSGSVYHLQRDPSSTTGWAPVTIDLSGNVTEPTDVAVAGNSSATYMLVFGSPADPSGGPAWVTRLDSPTNWDEGFIATYDDLGFGQLDITEPTLGQFKGGIDQNYTCYFYASATDASTQTTSIVGWVPQESGGEFSLGFQLLQSIDSSELTISDYIVLFDTSNGQAPAGYSLILTGDQSLNVYAQQHTPDQVTPVFGANPIDDAGGANVTALLWAWATLGSKSGVPGYAYQTATATWFVPEDKSPAQSLTDKPSASRNSVAVWTGDLNVVNALDADGTLNTVLQLTPGDPTTTPPTLPTWQLPIPTVPGTSTDQDGVKVPGLAAIFGVPTDPTRSTLFAVGLDESLSVLTLDDSGWTQTLVRQDAASQVEIDSYRVQVSVLDANGVPVPGAAVSVLPDRPVGIWQPSGGSYATPDAAATLVSDYTGLVTFSVPAEEMDAAQLTVTPVDANNQPTGPAADVYPDTDVRAFLNGTGTLTDIGPMAGGNALLQAKNSSGGDLFPGLTGLSGGQQTQALAASTKALSTFIAAGTKTRPADGTQSLQLAMSNGIPAVSSSTEAFAFGPAPAAAELQSSLGHLFDTIGHALRHGAAKLASLTAHFVDEATGWVISIGAEIAGALQTFTSLVISDMEDAFHAVGGFFQALGADINEGLQWLRHNVAELLTAAWANGKTIPASIGTAPAGFAYQVGKLNFTVDNFFADLESKATALINDLDQAVTGQTLGSAPNQTPPAPGSTGGSSSAQSGLAKDFGLFTRVINDTPGMWLYHKFQQDVLPIASLGMPTPPQGNYDNLVNNQLAQDWTDGKALCDALEQFMKDEFVSAFGKTSSSAKQASMPGLYGSFNSYTFEDAASVVTKFLQFCDDIADTVLDIVIQALKDLTAVLTTPFKLVKPTSLLGLLLDDVLHIDPTLSISEIIGMIIGFPATLVGKILGKGDTLPALPALPTSGAALAGAVGMDPELKLWLGILGGTTQAIWGFADIIGDLQTLAGEDGKRGTQSGVIDMFDIWCPLFETFFLFPYDPVDGAIQWAIPPMVLTALLPSVMGVLALFEWPGITSKLVSAGIDDSITNALAEYVGPFVQAFSGAANTAIGITFQVKTDDTYWVDLAGTALGNLSFMLAVFGTLWLNSTTEDVPVIVKTVVDAIGNIGAAVCIYESTSLPPTR